MSSAKRLLFSLSAIVVALTFLGVLLEWFAPIGLSLAIGAFLLYLSLGFCDLCREYGSDCTCGHGKRRREVHESQRWELGLVVRGLRFAK